MGQGGQPAQMAQMFMMGGMGGMGIGGMNFPGTGMTNGVDSLLGGGGTSIIGTGLKNIKNDEQSIAPSAPSKGKNNKARRTGACNAKDSKKAANVEPVTQGTQPQ